MNIYMALFLLSLLHFISVIIFVVLCNIFLKGTEKNIWKWSSDVLHSYTQLDLFCMYLKYFLIVVNHFLLVWKLNKYKLVFLCGVNSSFLIK